MYLELVVLLYRSSLNFLLRNTYIIDVVVGWENRAAIGTAGPRATNGRIEHHKVFIHGYKSSSVGCVPGFVTGSCEYQKYVVWVK